MRTKINKIITNFKQFFTLQFRRFLSRVDQNPFTIFLSLLGIVVLLIVVGNYFRTPSIDESVTESRTKEVSMYSIGQAPLMTMQAKVEKTSAVKVQAQSAGIVQKLTLSPGQNVKKGQTLAWLSTNTLGASIPSISRQIAQNSYTLAQESLPIQQELIVKRRTIAQTQSDQSEELRVISEQSLSDTRTLIAMNEEIYKTLDDQVKSLEGISNNATASALLLQAQQGRAGILSGLNALRTALRNTEYQANAEQEPTQMTILTKEMTLKQLELEEKSLLLNSEMALLNLRIAQISESLMRPASPCNGVIERYYVRFGQSVNPGQQIASIKCDSGSTTLIVAVSKQVATQVSRLEPAEVTIQDKIASITPQYISQEPTEGTLHSMLYILPEHLEQYVSDGSYVQLSIPVGVAETSGAVPFIPVDAVYQTDKIAYIYIAESGEADTLRVVTREITVGKVVGSYIEVHEGLNVGDRVILDRNVMEGDLVSTQL